MTQQRDWVTWIAMGLSALVLMSFLGAVHPFFDQLGSLRLTLAAFLFVSAVTLLLMGKQMSALFAGIVANIAIATILIHLGGQQKFSTPDMSIMQVNASLDPIEMKAFIKEVHNQEPQIVTMQNISEETRWVTDEFVRLYPYSAVCLDSNAAGVAVFSKFMFHDGHMPHCDQDAGLVVVGIDTPVGPLQAASLQMNVNENLSAGARRARVVDFFKESEGPVVLAGAFNGAKWSHELRSIADAAGAVVAPGAGLTGDASLLGFLSGGKQHVLVPEAWSSNKARIQLPGLRRRIVMTDVFAQSVDG